MPSKTAFPERQATEQINPQVESTTQPAQRGWPFSRLTDWQRQQQFELAIALRAGQLRGTPTCFGELL